MKEVIVNNSQYANQLASLKKYVKSELEHPDADGGINSQYIHQCLRLIVARKTIPSCKKISASEKISIIMNNYAKDKWMKIFRINESPQIIQDDVTFVNNQYGLYGNIDCIARINKDPFAFMFRRVSSNQIEKIKESGPFTRDILTMISNLGLSEFCDGIIVYDHIAPLFFHIKNNLDTYNEILKKCKKIQDLIANNTPPKKCANYKNKSCFKTCRLIEGEESG